MATTKTKKTTTTGTKKKAPAKKAVKAATTKKSPAKKAAPAKTPAKKAAVKKTTAKATPKKTTTAKKRPFRNSFKKEMQSMLLENKKHLLSEINQKIKQESDGHKKEMGDIYDIASSERERELTLMLGDRDRKKIQQVYRALEWLEEEEYGLCEECGEPIGDNRMRALPFTRVCVECKSKLEKNTLYKGRLDDGPAGTGDKSDSDDVF
ncbi:hypothetical protein MNBD_DELTA01-82 [hydrothermal vent metagenome]|uniref:Uncharacterized protein n=1 Tax=hydrothermal vent metagenome TaxID=652676 RepID=A0A3B0QQE8_9ZZZZ